MERTCGSLVERRGRLEVLPDGRRRRWIPSNLRKLRNIRLIILKQQIIGREVGLVTRWRDDLRIHHLPVLLIIQIEAVLACSSLCPRSRLIVYCLLLSRLAAGMLLLRHRPRTSISSVEAALELRLRFAAILCVAFVKSQGRSVGRGERNR